MTSASKIDRSEAVHDIFILPELRYPRQQDLGILILPDGNKRSDPLSGGYEKGARKVVEVAEHLARRPDLAVMVACVLSRENIAARTDNFFANLYHGFVHLGTEIANKNTLVGSRIRAELCGNLQGLRDRRGHAAALADAIEAVIEQTSVVTEPKLRLFFGVGYPSTTPRDLDIDIVLRTGLEDESALRLSGLCSHPSIANYAMTKLWPEVELRDVDEIIDAAKRCRVPGFSIGYSPSTIVETIRAIGRAPLALPARVSLATHASPQAMADALERLYADGPLEEKSVAVKCTDRVHGKLREYRPREAARHEIHILFGEQTVPPLARAGYTSMLAPGQRQPLLVLPEWEYGYATIHACEATPRGIVEGIRAAERFCTTHAALHGAERELKVAPGSAAAEPGSARFTELLGLVERHRSRPVEELAGALASRELPGAAGPETLATLFAAKVMSWSASFGLQLPQGTALRALLNQVHRAFFTLYRIGPGGHAEESDWEPGAALLARCMLVTAAGEEGIFARTLPGETVEQRKLRLSAAEGFLQAAIKSADQRLPPPPGPAEHQLATIARFWQDVLAEYGSQSHPAVVEGWRGALSRLYRDRVAEPDGTAADPPLIAQLTADDHGRRAALGELKKRPADRLTPRLAGRIQELITGIEETPERAVVLWDELRVLLHLGTLGGAACGGLLFWTVALLAPSASVTDERLESLRTITSLVDLWSHLTQDISRFLSWTVGARDGKANACSILLPAESPGVPRAAAVVRALSTCKRVAAWLHRELQDRSERNLTLWPYLGRTLRRSVLLGDRINEVAHFSTLSPAQVSALFAEFAASSIAP